MIAIDGNYLEGGGQIVRTALALSALTGKPFAARDIRKGRDNPGLKAQHLHCITALQELCQAKVSDASLGSETLTFIPGQLKPKTLAIDIGTAGSITLLLQSLLPVCVLGTKPIRLHLTGGTDVPWSMPFDYFRYVLLPQLRMFAQIDIALERRGYYPKGGGKVDIKVNPYHSFSQRGQAPHLELLEQGTLTGIDGYINASKDLMARTVAERIERSASLNLGSVKAPKTFKTSYSETLSTGCGAVLAARYTQGEDYPDKQVILGADCLGEKQTTAEDVAKKAAVQLLNEISSGACCDRHLADNLIPYLGLFGGAIKTSEITRHTLTNIHITEQFLERTFSVDKENNIIRSS